MENNFIFAAEESSPIDLTKISGVAYSGNSVRQWWSRYPVIIDLAGMTQSPQIPLLYNHSNDPECRLGALECSSDGRQLLVNGAIDQETERGKCIVDAGKKIAWQMSVGAEIIEAVRVDEGGESRIINGREFQPPFLHVTKSILREVSVVAVGADPETTMRIAASFNMNKKEFTLMGPNENDNVEAALKKNGVDITPQQKTNDQTDAITAAVQAQLKAREEEEEKRRVAVTAALADYPDVAAKAISEKWTESEAKRVASAMQLQNLSPSCGNIIMRSAPEVSAKAIESAIAMQFGFSGEELLKSYGQKTVEAADTMRSLSLGELVMQCALLEGKSVGRSWRDHDTIKAGFSTVSLPGILSNVANKVLLRSYLYQAPTAPKLCSKGNLADFKESERYRINDLGGLKPLSPAGELKHGEVSEDKATNKLSTYGEIFTLTRNMIINDDLNALQRIFQGYGRKAGLLIDELFYTRLLANPGSLFSTANKNLKTGTGSVLAIAGVKDAMVLFMQQTDAGGNPIMVRPRYLVVPTTLYPTALELLSTDKIIGGSTATPDVNIVNKFGLEIVESPFLENANLTGNSAKAWYLWGDPNMIDTFEIGYLNGKETPTAEFGSVNFDTLGMSFRMYFDVGIREQGTKGFVKSKGEA